MQEVSTIEHQNSNQNYLSKFQKQTKVFNEVRNNLSCSSTRRAGQEGIIPVESVPMGRYPESLSRGAAPEAACRCAETKMAGICC